MGSNDSAVIKSRPWSYGLAVVWSMVVMAAAGCGPATGGSGDAGDAAEPLESCLPGWWMPEGFPKPCGTYYCHGASFTTPECDAADCQEATGKRYGADHTLLTVTFTYSAQQGHLSAKSFGVAQDTWSLDSDGYLYIDDYTQTKLDETCTAEQLTGTMPGTSQPIEISYRMAQKFVDALEGAAESGTWENVPVE